MRMSEFTRKTKETEVKVKVNLDGKGFSEVKTGTNFLDHLIKILSAHSLFDITVNAEGDLQHHIIEDVAICLGETIDKILGDREGIKRFGFAMVPMDCSLASVAVDLAKRPYVKIDFKLQKVRIEDLQCEDLQHFIESFAMALKANIHMLIHYGLNDHHKVESAFKALSLSLRTAVSIDPRREGVPSSKGVI
jgi:imidazoleglycerol-phosphate dehydratase